MNEIVHTAFLPENPATMSSREIADLCEKQHAHVCRDIRTMLDDLGIGQSSFGSTYFDAQGKERSCFVLPKDLTLTLVSGYNVQLRHRIVKRLEEYERNRAFQIPQTLPEALRLAADATERADKAEAQVEEMRPTVQAFDRIAKADGSLCITDAAKTLQVRPKDLTDWLQAHGWIYKRVGKRGWLAYQPKLQQGLLEHKCHSFTRADGTEGFDERVRVTPKGLAKLAELLSGGRA